LDPKYRNLSKATEYGSNSSTMVMVTKTLCTLGHGSDTE